MPSVRPVVFLAFADARNDLDSLRVEGWSLRDQFDELKQRGVIADVIVEERASLERLYAAFQKYRDRIALFHFGGHADGDYLLLQSALEPTPAYADGLATLLGQQRGLKLVFLNGCSTRPQVKRLLDAGVPAVVATAKPIVDVVAVEFAMAFYRALTTGGDGLNGGLSVAAAFAAAQGFVNAAHGGPTRNLVAETPEHGDVTDDLGFPWSLQVRKGAEQVERWNLFDDDPLFGLPPLPDDIGWPAEPFRKLEWFGREHARIFFGRGRAVRELYDLLTRPAGPADARVLLYYGQTGVGKTSVLAAGLLPRLEGSHRVRYLRRSADLGLLGTLKAGLFDLRLMSSVMDVTGLPSEGTALIIVADVRNVLHFLIFDADGNKVEDTVETQLPGKAPEVSALKSQLRALWGVTQLSQDDEVRVLIAVASIVGHTRFDPAADPFALGRAWRAAETGGRPLVVVLDQAEEVYTRPLVAPPSADDAEALARTWVDPEAEVRALVEAVRAAFDPARPERPAGRLVLGFRKEWLDEFEKACKAASLSFESVPLGPLDRGGAVEAIEGPAREPGYRLAIAPAPPGEPPLAEFIADDLLDTLADPRVNAVSPVAPTLQVLLTRMWADARARDRDRPTFDRPLYVALKEKGYELDKVLDQQLAAIGEEDQEAVLSGLILDLLDFFTTPLGTAAGHARGEVHARYPRQDASRLDGLLRRCQDRYLLVETGVGTGRDVSYRLVHDTLAPLVRDRFQRSLDLGPRARRTLEKRALEWADGRDGPPLDPHDLSVIKDAKPYMPALTPDQRRLIAASHKAERRRLREKEESDRKLVEAQQGEEQARDEHQREIELRLKDQKEANLRQQADNRRLRRLFYGLLGGLALALIFLALAAVETKIAGERRKEAEKSADEAKKQTVIAETNATRAQESLASSYLRAIGQNEFTFTKVELDALLALAGEKDNRVRHFFFEQALATASNAIQFQYRARAAVHCGVRFDESLRRRVHELVLGALSQPSAQDDEAAFPIRLAATLVGIELGSQNLREGASFTREAFDVLSNPRAGLSTGLLRLPKNILTDLYIKAMASRAVGSAAAVELVKKGVSLGLIKPFAPSLRGTEADAASARAGELVGSATPEQLVGLMESLADLQGAEAVRTRTIAATRVLELIGSKVWGNPTLIIGSKDWGNPTLTESLKRLGPYLPDDPNSPVAARVNALVQSANLYHLRSLYQALVTFPEPIAAPARSLVVGRAKHLIASAVADQLVFVLEGLKVRPEDREIFSISDVADRASVLAETARPSDFKALLEVWARIPGGMAPATGRSVIGRVLSLAGSANHDGIVVLTQVTTALPRESAAKAKDVVASRIRELAGSAYDHQIAALTIALNSLPDQIGISARVALADRAMKLINPHPSLWVNNSLYCRSLAELAPKLPVESKSAIAALVSRHARSASSFEIDDLLLLAASILDQVTNEAMAALSDRIRELAPRVEPNWLGRWLKAMDRLPGGLLLTARSAAVARALELARTDKSGELMAALNELPEGVLPEVRAEVAVRHASRLLRTADSAWLVNAASSHRTIDHFVEVASKLKPEKQRDVATQAVELARTAPAERLAPLLRVLGMLGTEEWAKARAAAAARASELCRGETDPLELQQLSWALGSLRSAEWVHARTAAGARMRELARSAGKDQLSALATTLELLPDAEWAEARSEMTSRLLAYLEQSDAESAFAFFGEPALGSIGLPLAGPFLNLTRGSDSTILVKVLIHPFAFRDDERAILGAIQDRLEPGAARWLTPWDLFDWLDAHRDRPEAQRLRLSDSG
jgi:hypothetical protein